ncbi:iron-sulfur cluster co-chaperone protein HscB-like [Haliotis rubra]|uniref:iron-sulfur cluster co-chaperone protein HscB-like n=1 Tax=Haliotis rubra TaxID=36100 RepID=UPI001EE62249|nr:iron-sulfur cluster co-chaperone protein HscB-like [Haliotis rubra]
MAASIAMMRNFQTYSANFIYKTLRNKGRIPQRNKHSSILLYENSSNGTVRFVRRFCTNATNCIFETHRSRRIFSTSTVRFYSSGRKCWKCNRDTSASSELYFCECGVVQASISDMNYFSLFGIDITFDIDEQSLSRMHKDLQMKLHPDKFTLKSEEERHHADQQSALVNKGYYTLLKPLSRGLYMLEHYGYAIEESTGDVDPEFLMDIMDMNERLDEAGSDEEVREIEEEVTSLIQNIIKDISSAFKDKDLDLAKRLIIRYQYFGNIDDKVRERYRKAM